MPHRLQQEAADQTDERKGGSEQRQKLGVGKGVQVVVCRRDESIPRPQAAHAEQAKERRGGRMLCGGNWRILLRLLVVRADDGF